MYSGYCTLSDTTLSEFDSYNTSFLTTVDPCDRLLITMHHHNLFERVTQGAPNKLYVQRDYSHGIEVKFNEDFPVQLTGKIDKQQYTAIIRQINEYYALAERISFHSVLENCLGCLTAYLTMLCIPTQYEKYARQASEFVEESNVHILNPRGINLGDPMDKGLRCIEITILDNHVGSGSQANQQRQNRK
ncbi:hypothetical protein GJ496_005366 [Pomphorhynchus laevis]|nr:hypothetical protein GJ496_005366 [Pomphorhynchus laevis]